MRDHQQSRWLRFVEPLDVLVANDLADVQPMLARAEARVNADGLYAAGYVAYEAAAGFDPALETRRPGDWPLLCLGLYARPEVRESPGAAGVESDQRQEWTVDIARPDYRRIIRSIKDQIALGNTYQVNFTIRARTESAGDPWAMFLRVAADAPFAAYIEAEHCAIISASPELFFRLADQDLECKPMKGTAPRGMTLLDDRALRAQLDGSSKDRAENVMIADMIRNDVGRIAEPGSVTTGDLFRIEKYPTVWQMTSTVRARTGASVTNIFSALFPCASVTGAPKVASMQLIAGFEDSERHIYTGAIGYMAPGRQAQFSVAIRTAFVDRRDDRAVYGIGGGIVWSSDAEDEYEECLAKARVLHRDWPQDEFQLLETLLWTQEDGFFLLDRHLQRMAESAEYFDMPFDPAYARQALSDAVLTCNASRQRVRLLLAASGRFTASASASDRSGDRPPVRLRLASAPIDPGNPFFYHKTTWRDCYNKPLAKAGDCDDVLLWNTDGLVTETTIANVLVRTGTGIYTPPVRCGLLAGTYRNWMLDQGLIEERPISISELADAEIMVINSVRGQVAATLIGSA